MKFAIPRLVVPEGILTGLLAAIAFSQLPFATFAADKSETVRGTAAAKKPREIFARPAAPKQVARKIAIGGDDRQIPLVGVQGSPYEMVRQLGETLRLEIQQFIPNVLKGICDEMQITESELAEVWSRTAAFADDRVEQELAGLADGTGLPLTQLQAAHALPLVMPYSCSSVAVWGKATEDGHLYQTRNLDWSMKAGAHNFPAVVLYLPNQGIPHVIPTFAGVIGAHTGMNARGIALAEMGDAGAEEAPYQVHAPHFTIFFRTMLYDADSLTETLKIFKAQPMTKRYHFVFGDGQKDHRAVKIRAHAPESLEKRLSIWSDNDPTDEFAPRVSTCLVYNDEGRGAFPLVQKQFGKLNGEKLVEIANLIPIKGGNVVNVVYDATALRFWVSYAKGDQEAYLRPYTYVDLKTLDTDGNGAPDLEEYARQPLAGQ